MTGTSADAVDAVLVRFTGSGLDSRHEVLRYRETPLEPELRHEVLEIAGADTVAPERMMRLDAALGERYAAAVFELLAEAGLDARDVDAIGCHGQTVRHVPRAGGGGQALTLQLGSAALLAERTGVTVVSDFRSRDTAAGGEGAPLVPIADWWLFRSEDESRVLLNLGGMANVTYLPRGRGIESVMAFDTGPGNAILDGLARTGSLEAEMDAGGAAAARGKVHRELLLELLGDPFFHQPPPRSTGRERFGGAYVTNLRARARGLGLTEEDLLATAAQLTAESVAGAVDRFLIPLGVDAVYASGGGVRNATVMKALARRLGECPLRPLDALGVAAESKEALAFALLAHLTLCGRAGNVPAATGARHPAVLGSITPGALS
jgi:anhydro-N-acetylmuramic acid kinase